MIKIENIDEIVWDRLPVIKMIKYPWDEKLLAIFAQSRICFNKNKGLFLRQWAFEVEPISQVYINNSKKIYDDSLLTLVIGNSNKMAVSISFNNNGNYIVLKKELEKEEIILDEAIDIRCFKGEDLQGIYWGGEYIISNEFLLKHLSIDILAGDKFYMNFIKNCNQSEYKHCGGFLEVGENIYSNLREVKIVNLNSN